MNYEFPLVRFLRGLQIEKCVWKWQATGKRRMALISVMHKRGWRASSSRRQTEERPSNNSNGGIQVRSFRSKLAAQKNSTRSVKKSTRRLESSSPSSKSCCHWCRENETSRTIRRYHKNSVVLCCVTRTANRDVDGYWLQVWCKNHVQVFRTS